MTRWISPSSSDTGADEELMFAEADREKGVLFPWHSGHASVPIGMTECAIEGLSPGRMAVPTGPVGEGEMVGLETLVVREGLGAVPFEITTGSMDPVGNGEMVGLETLVVREGLGAVPFDGMTVPTGSGIG